MKRAWLWPLVAVLAIGLAGPVWGQEGITLEVLNPPIPGTLVVPVVQGEPVQVAYSVGTLPVETGPDDVIQLLNSGDESVVSQQERGEALSGTVSLSTSPSNAVGDLAALYVLADGSVVAQAPEIVRVTPSGPSEVTVPSTEAPTIQAGINLVADGGTVNIRSGTYREKLLIVGKRVDLVGAGTFGFRRTMIAGSLPRTVVPYQQAQGLISFGPRGGGSISNLILQGGDAGVVGLADDSGTPAPVQIKNAVIRLTGRGVLGSFGGLVVDRVAIVGMLSNGIAVVSHDGEMELVNGIVGDVGGVGIMIYNFDDSTGTISIYNEAVGFFEDGGIVIAGDANDVYIHDCFVGWGNTVGILLAYAGYVGIQYTHVEHIAYGDPGSGPTVYDNVADGLISAGTDYVSVVSSTFKYCERSGMLFDFGSVGSIVNTWSGTGNRFGLVVQGEPKPDYSDPSNLFSGTEQPILTDGALPVPDPPPLPEEP